MGGSGPAASSQLRVGIGVAPESRGGSSRGSLAPARGQSPGEPRAGAGTSLAPFGLGRSSSGAGLQLLPARAPLARAGCAGETGLGLELAFPKGLPSALARPLPHPSIRVKPPFGGLRLGVRLAGSGRRRCACLGTQVNQRGAKQDGAPQPSPGSISHRFNEGLPRALGS